MIDRKMKFLGVAALACAPFSAFAQDAAVPADAGEKAAPKKIVIELPQLPSAENVKVKVSGLVQAQYVYATASGKGASDQNGFSVRRSTIGVTADVGDNWGAKIVYEFDSKATGGTEDNGYIDTAIISRKFDAAGTLIVGHKKTHFMHEEYSPSSKFPCLERSINSNFVTGNSYVRGLSGYHIGAFWEGKISDKIDYGASLTNAVAKDYDSRSNDLAVTANAGYNLKFDKKTALYFGLNATLNFGDDGNNFDEGKGEKNPLSNAGTVYGIEPYVQFTVGGFSALADFFYINDCGGAKISDFYGLNLTATYRFENGFEPAVRVTYLNTDSGAVNAKIQNRVPDSGGFNNAATYYVGVNYYFNKYVKIAGGYEYGHYFGGGNVDAADSGAFRTMLQVSF